MRRQGKEPLIPLDPELERTLNIIRRERRDATLQLQDNMENHQDPKNQPNPGGNLNQRVHEQIPQASNEANNHEHQPIYQLDDPQMLLDNFALPLTAMQLVIWRQPIQANNFELKSILLQLLLGIQFNGLPSEDPITT